VAVHIKNKALLENGVRQRCYQSTRPATIGEVLDEYAAFCETQKPRSWDTRKVHLKAIRAAFSEIIADELTTAHTDQYRATRKANDKCGDSTINRDLACLRAALNREMKRTPPRVHRIPFMNLVSEKDCVREGFIERKDYLEILSHLPASIKAIFVGAFHTGARVGELRKIQWAQVDFARGIIELQAKTTKNSEGRWIPIWGDMREYLEKQKAIRDAKFPECPWVFFWHGDDCGNRAIPGGQLGIFQHGWDKAVTAAGYPNLLFHDLRRSAIKFADQEVGMPSRLVRLMSGHKTEYVYHRYNIAGANDVAKMGRVLDEFVRGPKVVEIKKRA
jgi:integrase